MTYKINIKKGQSYTVYSDESHITGSRFRSIACLSLPSKYNKLVSTTIFDLFKESNISELKWHKLKNAKNRFGAIKLIDYLTDIITKYSIRIDILVWDIKDERHQIKKRDDIANFGRMYFHLLKFVMSKREDNSSWRIYPDENGSLDWVSLKDSLKSVGNWTNLVSYPLEDLTVISQKYIISDLEESSSHHHPLIQACDFFAGLAVFSIYSYQKYIEWLQNNSTQFSLFHEAPKHKLSSSDNERFMCMNHFIAISRKNKLGVSIKTKKRLWTPINKNPINFWHYEPQHDLDKAPTH